MKIYLSQKRYIKNINLLYFHSLALTFLVEKRKSKLDEIYNVEGIRRNSKNKL
jgi:hypothetical protein